MWQACFFGGAGLGGHQSVARYRSNCRRGPDKKALKEDDMFFIARELSGEIRRLAEREEPEGSRFSSFVEVCKCRFGRTDWSIDETRRFDRPCMQGLHTKKTCPGRCLPFRLALHGLPQRKVAN